MASALYLTSLLCCPKWAKQKRTELIELCGISFQPLHTQSSSSLAIAITLVNLHTITRYSLGHVFLFILYIINYVIIDYLVYYVVHCTIALLLLYYYIITITVNSIIIS